MGCPGAGAWLDESELFGLHPVPERPAANYQRLSRYDETGLVWLLRGHPVVALMETEAAIQAATARPHLPQTSASRVLGLSATAWTTGGLH